MSPRTRRHILGALAGMLVARPAAAQSAGRVVIIGGGFAGAGCARALRQMAPKINVTLIEPSAVYTACPFSNEVIAGLRDIEAQRFEYKTFAVSGIDVVRDRATAVDATARRVTLAGGDTLTYDRLVVAPGIDLRWDALPGYDERAAVRMPHAWKAGEQTLLLRRQLEAMADGGTVVMSVPADPYRCPSGPYERASLIASYLKTQKPRSKLLILDAKDAFAKQPLFTAAWAAMYPKLLEWVPLAHGGKVASVDAGTYTLSTDFATYRADVANVIPPQRAGRIAEIAGVADRSGWCPVDAVTFESTLQPGIHVIGDAAIAGAMPKSAFAANAQAKICADAIVHLLAGRAPAEPRLIDASYSLVAPGYGISAVSAYRPIDGRLTEVDGPGGLSPLAASASLRRLEAEYAEAWFKTITTDTFG